jgi:RimJ/RimL family protein N-acetyltransferase
LAVLTPQSFGEPFLQPRICAQPATMRSACESLRRSPLIASGRDDRLTCDHGRSLARLGSLIDHQQRHGFSKWAVIEKATGGLIGDCGLQYLDGGPDIELGFHLARGYWGQGYATEAARACLAWARAERAERVVAIVDPANQRSTRVLRRIGMSPAGTASYFGREWLLLVTRPQASPAG